ncbi:sulfotransferase family protein [Chromohalobacter israelensis]|uniref:sulfotransferase family protein n=1 Tax=Chromohalobacter israelensis TaxID=141390 RepID=UPI000A0299B3|nr:sulfotransferase [Chromohalobacter israelensis]MDF9436052.1 sulfotransferase [Chromohalobacter israelensis]
MKPNFLGIGAQKSGTTWLHYMLIQHPEIFLPKAQKELHFFDNKANYNKGLDFYESFFSDQTTEVSVGEITPGYMWSDDTLSKKYSINEFRFSTPERVQKILGDDVKFIVILRDPVIRAVSAYFHHLKRNRVSVADSILDIKGFGLLHIGFYYRNLRRWFEIFGRDSFHVATFEELNENKERYLRSVFEFLGVDSDFVPVAQDKKYQINADYYLSETGAYMLKGGSEDLEAVSLSEVESLKVLYSEDANLLRDVYEVDTSLWGY